MRFTPIILFTLIVASVNAQQLTITAKVLDKDTREPLSYAAVGIRGKPLGTIANLQGEFDFHFPEEFRNELFVVSMLGYQNYEVPVWTLLDPNEREILMTKSNTVLETVLVSDSLTGGDIVRIALSRVEQNYPNQPYNMDGFYRDLKKIGGTYVSLLEAAIKLYDEDYKEPRNKFRLRERVRLLEVRRSLGYTHRFTTYFDEDNLLEEMLLHNNIRYRQFPEEEVFFASLKRLKDTWYNNREIFVVEHHGDFELKLLVDKKSFGILHMEYENNAVQPIVKKRGMQSKFVGLRKVIDYREYEGKLFLNYMSVSSKINWYDARTDAKKFETELEQQLLINQVFPVADERIGISDKMKSYGLQYQDQPYNKKFWDSYNVIKDSPLDKKIIADLERDGALDTQFEKY